MSHPCPKCGRIVRWALTFCATCAPASSPEHAPPRPQPRYRRDYEKPGPPTPQEVFDYLRSIRIGTPLALRIVELEFPGSDFSATRVVENQEPPASEAS